MELMHNAFPLSVTTAPNARHEWEREIIDMVGNLISQQMEMLQGEERKMEEGEIFCKGMLQGEERKMEEGEER